MLVNLCYVSRGMRVRKVSNRKTDVQGHYNNNNNNNPICKAPECQKTSVALKGIGNGAIRSATYDFLLVFYCNYVVTIGHL